MSDSTFADGVGAITVVGATVRLDLMTLVPGEEGPVGRPKPTISHRLVMPIDGFLAAAHRIAEAVEAMRKMEASRGAGAAVPLKPVIEAPAEQAAESPPKPPTPSPKRFFP